MLETDDEVHIRTHADIRIQHVTDCHFYFVWLINESEVDSPALVTRSCQHIRQIKPRLNKTYTKFRITNWP
jgi:hypothetical protein